ncbi:MAG TPA: hypothetical protein VGF44_01695 [Terriglobales bacterium]|jgi:hypothetical protein
MAIGEQIAAHMEEGIGQRCCLQIGGLSLGFTPYKMGIQLDPDHESFKIASSACEVEVDLEWVRQLSPIRSKKLFDSGAVWSLYEGGDEFIFDFNTPVLGSNPYKRLYIDKNFSYGQMLLVRGCYANEAHVHALEYPVDELIVTNWLARGRGVEVHGCGITDDAQNSYLFVGHSGAGKSTTTKLWQEQGNVRILSDDRIIIRKNILRENRENKDNHQFSMYGTPWHGEAGFASPEKAPLKQIFVLEHGERNEIVPLAQSAAAAELFARCFLPFHDPQALAATLAYLDELTRTVPCYKFQFLPDQTAVEKILEFQHSR